MTISKNPASKPVITAEEKKAAAQARMAKARAAMKTPRSEVSARAWETRRKQQMAEAVGLTPEQFKAGGEELIELTTKAVVAHASKTFRASAGKAAAVLVQILGDEKARPEIRLAAAKEVLDRAMGKAVQTTLVGNADDSVITLDRTAILNAARRITAASAQDIEPNDHPDAA